MVRKSQEAAVDAIKLWADAVQSITSSIPTPNLPYSDRLPRSEEFVASAYAFAGQLLTSQRKFAENMVEATKPLLGAKEGPAAAKGDTTKHPACAAGRDGGLAAHDQHQGPTRRSPRGALNQVRGGVKCRR
jgi:hypothetical protein